MRCTHRVSSTDHRLWCISTHSLSVYCVLGLCTRQRWSELVPKALSPRPPDSWPRRPCSQSSSYIYVPGPYGKCLAWFHLQAFTHGIPQPGTFFLWALDLTPSPLAGLCLGITSSGKSSGLYWVMPGAQAIFFWASFSCTTCGTFTFLTGTVSPIGMVIFCLSVPAPAIPTTMPRRAPSQWQVTKGTEWSEQAGSTLEPCVRKVLDTSVEWTSTVCQDRTEQVKTQGDPLGGGEVGDLGEDGAGWAHSWRGQRKGKGPESRMSLMGV